jgi:peptide/nickel transport system ATP-binding protein
LPWPSRCRPGLLIADEPTTALDVTTQAQIIALLRDLVDDFGMGLLLITHDLALVSEVADRIVVMQAGRVVETGPARALLASPQAPYTKMLLAAARHRVDLPPAPPPSPLLEVANVTRTYRTNRGLLARKGTFRAVDGVSLRVARGERVGIVGESGCGKSTLARAILGLEPLQGGTITLGGSRSGPGRARTRPCGGACQAVFQDPYGSFNPRHRVERLVSEPFHSSRPRPRAPTRRGRRRGADGRGASAPRTPEIPARVLGGQRQRIAIARALIIRPDLILFDEACRRSTSRCARRCSTSWPTLPALPARLPVHLARPVGRARGHRPGAGHAGGQGGRGGPTARVLSDPRHPYTRALLAAAPRLPDLPEPLHA